MLFSYNWLQEYLVKKLPPAQKLETILAMYAFEVEEVRKQGSDWIFDLAILPNRIPDAGNHYGLAREIAACTHNTLKKLDRKPAKLQKSSLAPLSVTIDSSELVPRFSAFVITGVQGNEQSPKWLRERLERLGVNSINTIVDLTNYVMLETGQPLHAFDYDTIQGQHMHVRLSKKGETLTTLDDRALALPEGTLVIEDAKELIDLAGIKGGKTSGITANTTTIVLQAATFNGPAIYAAKKKLQYSTNAGDLYAAGLDPNSTMLGLERALFLLKTLQKNASVVQTIDTYPKKQIPATIQFQLDKAQRILGTSITEKTATTILKQLGCTVTKAAKHSWSVRIPTYRRDLTIPEDLVEEIGRIYGYEHIEPVFPEASLLPHELNLNVLWQERMRDALKEAGYTEVYNYSFIGEQDPEVFQYTQQMKETLVELENPLSTELRYVRPHLAEQLLKNVAFNQKAEKRIALFELGNTASLWQGTIREQQRLAGVQNEPFYGIKGTVDFLFQQLGIPGLWYDTYRQTAPSGLEALWHPQRSAEIKVGDTTIGFIGEVSQRILAALKITSPVSLFELQSEALVKLATEEFAYQPPSKFPASIRDIALLVPVATKVADVLNIISITGKTLVQDVDVFDIYEGEKVPEGKKSLAFHIVYQANDRTLTSKEIDALEKQIVAALEQQLEWEVRT